MAIFLLRGGSGPEARSAIELGLRATIPALIEVSSFQQVFAYKPKAERGDLPIVIMIAPPGDSTFVDNFIKVAAAFSDKIFQILISNEISVPDYQRLLRTGAAEWSSAKASPSEVADIIARRRQQLHAPDAAAVRADNDQRPVTISFVPSAGGVGNTTLAVETAFHLKTNKETQQRKICIVDLDFQTSHVCDYLDSEPHLKIEELSSGPDRLDEHLFEIFRTRHSSGIDVFAAPRSKFSSDKLNIDALEALFNMIAKRYDLVLVDHPLSWFSWTTQVIAASDAAVITGINTIPCLRQISETLALIQSSGSGSLQIGIVLNRCERTLLGSVVRSNHVRRVLQDEQVFFMPQRSEAVESVNMGVPMMLGPSARKLRKELAPLADFCAKVKSTRQVLA
jgi:pilus assembly protein CpaE